MDTTMIILITMVTVTTMIILPKSIPTPPANTRTGELCRIFAAFFSVRI